MCARVLNKPQGQDCRIQYKLCSKIHSFIYFFGKLRGAILPSGPSVKLSLEY